MILRETLLDALADLRASPGRAILQALGILLGVASVVTVLTLVDTNRRITLEFFEKFGGLRKILVFSDPSRAVLQGARQRAGIGLRLTDVQALQREGTAFDLVDPVSSDDLVVHRGNFTEPLDVKGAMPTYSDVYQVHAVAGRFLTPHDVDAAERVVVLGDTVARRLFGGEPPLGQQIDVGGQPFTVVGILGRREFSFGARGHGSGNALEWMNQLVLVPLTAMTIRLHGDPRGRISYMNVMARTAADASRALAEVRSILTRHHGGVADFRAFDRQGRVQRMNQQMLAFNVTFLISAAVSLLVGGLVITNILLASFRTRVREIGVRKALGASNGHVFAQFLVESVLLTGGAGVLGLGLGKLFTVGCASLIGAVAPVSLATILVALGVAVTTGVIFGFHPALRAARLSPVEALRHE